MNRMIVPSDTFSAALVSRNVLAAGFAEIKTEAVRKGIHFLVALSPSMAAVSRPFTLAFLALGTLVYAGMETLRCRGINVPLVSMITRMAARERDGGRFVLGPVTLGAGAFLALLLFHAPASTIAIYALAFGDGFASLVGKVFGSIRPRFMMGKSIEGSAACLIAVLSGAWLITHDFRIALVTALIATVTEALPLEDYDNIALPVVTGFAVNLLLLA